MLSKPRNNSCYRIHETQQLILMQKNLRLYAAFGGFVLILLLIIGGYSLAVFPFHLPTTSRADTHSFAEEASSTIITYTVDGFNDDFVSVPINSVVTFKNVIDTPLMPVSDPFPSNTDYPAFNATSSYPVGSSYSFRFTQAGTYGYYNQYRPDDHGVIQVFDPSNPNPNIDKTKSSQAAIRDKLVAMLDPHDPSSILKVFQTITADPSLSVNCHDIGHDLGHHAYELYGFSGAMLVHSTNSVGYSSVENICAGGYMHGIMEELFLHQPQLKDHPADACATVPTSYKESCFHGVGHALMFLNKRALAPSLAACQSIGTALYTARCYEGVYMELFWGSTEHSGPGTLGWDIHKPLEPCISATADEKPDCFLYSSFGYLRNHDKDYSGAITLCTTSNLSESDTDFCLQGIGITMMNHFKGQHLEQSESFASGLTDSEKAAFYKGVIGYAYFSGISKSDLTQACTAMTTDSAACFTALAQA